MKINAAMLKWLAVITMITDHLAVMLMECIPTVMYYVMRGFGRLSFPIFCFLLVEGFVHTKSFSKYLIRMIVFAILSQIPYNILRYGNIVGGGYFNILFTFSVTLIVLYILSKCDMKKITGVLAGGISIAAGMTVAYMLNLEYSYKCILLAVIFYYTGIKIEHRMVKIIGAIAVLYIDCGLIGLVTPLSLIFIDAYNGEKGGFPKWLGYVFYPAHLFLFGMVKYYL